MKRLAVVALLALSIVGCGGRSSSSLGVAPTTTCMSLGPPCSAVTPEGASGADVTRYLNGPPPFALTGSGIRIDMAGLGLIEGFENVYQAVYCPFFDPYGHVWTRAFGETDWTGDFGGVCITHAQADRNVEVLVEADYQPAVRALNVNLSHDQVDALDDFVWNVGPGTLTGTLRGDLQHRAFQAAGGLMLEYDHAGGVVLAALRARRETEDRLLQHSEPVTPSHGEIVARWHAELNGHYRLRALLERDTTHEHCAHPTYSYRSVCGRWETHLQVEQREIQAFHHKDIY